MQGLPTIRAYDAGTRFYEAFLEYLDRNGAWWFCFVVTSRWIGFRLDTIAAIMLTAGAMLAMAIHNKVPLNSCNAPPYSSRVKSSLLGFAAQVSAACLKSLTALCIPVSC